MVFKVTMAGHMDFTQVMDILITTLLLIMAIPTMAQFKRHGSIILHAVDG
jgi:hypothetical protein